MSFIIIFGTLSFPAQALVRVMFNDVRRLMLNPRPHVAPHVAPTVISLGLFTAQTKLSRSKLYSGSRSPVRIRPIAAWKYTC